MGESPVTVRRAQARDMAFVIELWKKFSEEIARFDERYALRPDAEILWAKWAGQRLRDPDSIMLVAERAGECVGYLLAHADDAQPIYRLRRHGVVTDVFVEPGHRRTGIGRRMVEEALAFLKGRGISDCRANVLARNAPAREFWQKLGFGEFLCRVFKPL